MRLIALQICVGIAALVFLATLAAIARHRVRSGPQTKQSPALAEYLWAIIPWLMIITGALPAVRQIVASASEPYDAVAPVTRVLRSASYAFPSKTAVVIDEQQDRRQ